MYMWEVLLLTASQNFPKTAHFLPIPNAFGTSETGKINSSYTPQTPISSHHHSSYNRTPKPAKEISMIVRFS